MPASAVRPLAHEDLEWTVQLHRTGLRPSFFSRLGPGYMRAYHGSFVTSPHAFGLVAVLDGQPAGFVLVTTNAPAHYRSVIRRSGPRLVARATAALVVRPRLLAHFVSTRARRYARGVRRFGREAPKVAVARLQHPTSEIVHIVVADHARGAGIGTFLMAHVELTVQGLGSHDIEAKTADAAAFYEANGWERAGTVVDLEGDKLHVLRRSLGPRIAATGSTGNDDDRSADSEPVVVVPSPAREVEQVVDSRPVPAVGAPLRR